MSLPGTASVSAQEWVMARREDFAAEAPELVAVALDIGQAGTHAIRHRWRARSL